jgi:tetratricopeptide (TPR) repeat protein
MGSITAWMERTQVGAGGPEWELTLTQRILIAGRALWFYAGRLFVPYNLTFIYPRWQIDSRDPIQWFYPLGVIAVVAALFRLLGRLGRGPLTCILYFIVTLVPALGFVNIYPMRFSFVADHFQYLAGVGLMVLMCEALVRVIRLDAMWLAPLPALLGVLTWFQCQMYDNVRTLWETTLRRNPDAWIAHDHLGAIIGTSDIETALGHYATAQALNPAHIEAYIGMGNLLLHIGRTDQAIEQYRKAIQVRPEHPAPYYALGAGLSARGDLSGAAEAYQAALRVDPRFIPARLKLADLYMEFGRSEDAAREQAEAQRQMRQLLGR